MSTEAIIAAWLTAPSITALVGTRVALHELPQGTAYPNLVYTVLSVVPDPVVAYLEGPQRAWSRVQINAQALTISEVLVMHDALRALMDFQHMVSIGGKTIVSSRIDTSGALSKDVMTLAWTKPVDYKLYHYDAAAGGGIQPPLPLPNVVNFAFGDASPKLVFTVSAATTILQVNFVITTPFNGTGAALSVGTAGSPQLLLSTAQVDPYYAAEYETNPNVNVSSSVLLTITPGAGCTQGAGWIVLQTATP